MAMLVAIDVNSKLLTFTMWCKPYLILTIYIYYIGQVHYRVVLLYSMMLILQYSTSTYVFPYHTNTFTGNACLLQYSRDRL